MFRHLKTGLLLAALGLLSLVGPSPASAASEFRSFTGASIHGEDFGLMKFTITGNEVYCESATFTGTAPATYFETLTLTPTFSSCKLYVFGSTISASISGFGKEGCDFVISATEYVELKCPIGKDVTITAGTCVIHIPGQGIGFISFDTGTAFGTEDMTFTFGAGFMDETHTDGFLCPLEGSGTSQFGRFEGTVTATAKINGNPVDFTDN